MTGYKYVIEGNGCYYSPVFRSPWTPGEWAVAKDSRHGLYCFLEPTCPETVGVSKLRLAVVETLGERRHTFFTLKNKRFGDYPCMRITGWHTGNIE